MNGFIETMMKSKSFQRKEVTEYEQVIACSIPNQIIEIIQFFKSIQLKSEIQHQFIKQIISYLTIHIIELLIEYKHLITSAKGLQLKFFFSIIDSEMCGMKELTNYRKYLQPGIQASGLLLLDHSADTFDYDVFKSMLPDISGKLMHLILYNFHPDKLNPQPVDHSVLAKIDKDDGELPNAFELVD